MSRNKEPLCAADQLMAMGVSAESAGEVQARIDKLKARAEALNNGGPALCVYCKTRAARVGDGLPYCEKCPYCKRCGIKIGSVFADSQRCNQCAYEEDMGAMIEESDRALNERWGAGMARGYPGARLIDYEAEQED